ncbi:metal ABC transporter solute-binding protein, Zn/Mn family [Kitasatospora aureofaciens]|uniref:metal ABC transporter solute-binding protein, Zn/Mn family n=1 Tax=Kitasatospora aureofaciens TaxID=1894 RepID=UPI001C47E37A|nr:zinc ABC transporter substrate-binding protein [Kitasatospora aureofaciens]MBV6697758.1 zinc ABC transporter substrate-binding protein [Kitasatospora aureofaciens]
MRISLPTRSLRLALAAAVAALAATSACSTTSAKTSADAKAGDGKSGGGVVQVAAAENFWGSIAGQLGGDHVKVTSIITNPDTDPHAYEPTANDGRTVAGAKYVITNGAGYDAWSDKLLAANPADGRTALKVGDLVGVKEGGNPHQWYSPENVHKVIDKVTDDLKKLDPADAAYFDQQKSTYLTKTLAPYDKQIADIKAAYAGTPIGASESIVTPLAEALGLKLLTPEKYLDAISEGTDPTAQDKATVDEQIKTKQIKVYVYNSQNSTPDIQAQVEAAKAQGIPVATVTETLAPADTPFQDWQTTQLQGLAAALKQATGK